VRVTLEPVINFPAKHPSMDIEKVLGISPVGTFSGFS